MWKACKYLYYRIYSWNLKMWGESDIPEYNAMIAITMLLFLNIFSIPTVIESLTGIRIISVPELSKVTLALIILSGMGTSYFLFIHREKYREIEKEFNRETKSEKRKRGFWGCCSIL